MKLKRILATVLALAMVLSMMSFSVLADDANVVVLEAGTYPWSNDYVGKTVKAANGAEVVLDMTVNGTPGLGGADVTFEGITFNWSNENYKGLQHSGNLTYNNCVINGQVFLYGASETFNNCTFNQSSSDAYNVWTYGAKEVSFNNCTFNSAGKSVLVYHESQATSVEVENTTFNASTSVKGKAAIEIDTSLMNGNTTVTVDEATTANGFSEETISGNSLWNVKKDPAVKESTTVVSVAEETVYAKVVDTEGNVSDPVANVNGVPYASVKDAINAAQAGDTVTIMEGTYAVPTMKAGITVVGKGNVLLEGTLSGTLENLTLKNLHIKGANAQRWAYAKGDLVFENVTFDATSIYALHFDGITEGTNLLYKNCTIIGWAAMGGSPASCVFDGCTIKDNGSYGVIRTYFDAEINNCTFDVDGANQNDPYQDGIHAVDATVKVNNCTNANGDMEDVINVSGKAYIYVDDELALAPEAKIGEEYYAKLTSAIAAAQDGDVITVLGIVEENITITKNGITLEGVLNNAGIASYNNTGVSKLAKAAEKSDYVSAIYGTIDATAAKDVTIKNLYVNADGENAISIRDGVVENVMVEDAWKAFVLSYAKADDHVDIKNCTVIDTVYVAHNDEASETTTYTFENNYFKSSFGITMGKSGLITVAGNTIIHDSEAYPNYDYGILRHFNAPIKAYENTLIGVKYSKKVAETVGEVYKNYFSLGIENAEETDKKVEIPSYYLDENRTMLYIADKKLVDATVATKASIAFERVEDGDDYVIYDMAIKADDNAIINLVSAQMKFTLDDLAVKANGMSVAYEISGANGFVVSQDSVTGKYLFNLPEGTNGTIGKKSGESVVIGRIKITGYTHKVNESEVKAIVNVTEGFYNYKDINDSIAEVEMPITDSSLEHSKTVASQKLIINVRFPNSIKDNASAYQDMKVEITGGDLNESVKFVLGSDGKYVLNDEGAYEVEQMLTKDTTYTVTVSGAGYRTARYTVTMTEDKTINFWNNVMDNDTVVEEGKHTEKKNFLAGDIVKDNNINIYDLSAVVSYFGTVDLSADNNPDYAKYDLNRDGVIDSKDVAYVLVSWSE